MSYNSLSSFEEDESQIDYYIIENMIFLNGLELNLAKSDTLTEYKYLG